MSTTCPSCAAPVMSSVLLPPAACLSDTGRQSYHCKSCGHRWAEIIYRTTGLTLQERIEALEAMLRGGHTHASMLAIQQDIIWHRPVLLGMLQERPGVSWKDLRRICAERGIAEVVAGGALRELIRAGFVKEDQATPLTPADERTYRDTGARYPQEGLWQ